MRLLLAFAALPILSGAALADCADDIRGMMSSVLSSGPYHMETTVTSPARSIVMSGKVIPPTALQITSVMGGQTTEMIMLDGKSWMQMAGTWTEMPAEVAATMAEAFSPQELEVLDTITDAQCLGEQPLAAGGTALKFSYAFTVAQIATTTTVYADTETLLPFRVESSSLVEGTPIDTVATYRYDPAITIAPPAM